MAEYRGEKPWSLHAVCGYDMCKPCSVLREHGIHTILFPTLVHTAVYSIHA